MFSLKNVLCGHFLRFAVDGLTGHIVSTKQTAPFTGDDEEMGDDDPFAHHIGLLEAKWMWWCDYHR